MDGNIGWIYNKKYYYELKGESSNGDLLYKQNEELIKIVYDEYCQKQLIDERNSLLKSNTGFVGLNLRICYPGLITGIGINHQTTINWERIINNKSIDVPEYKLGMCFDHTTGMPLIPGASVKGVLRSLFPILNQKKVCDNYDEKCRYIAGVIERVILIDEWENFQDEKIEQLKWKHVETEYARSVPEEQNLELLESLKREKERELERSYEDGKITIEEWDQKSEKIEELVEEDLKRQKKQALECFYRNCNARYRKAIDGAARNDYLTFMNNLWNSPLSDEPSSKSENMAHLLAIEMFEGKKDGKLLPSYLRDVFLDAIIIEGGKDGKIFEKDYITPHKDKFSDPKPICFMKIGPGVKLQFCFCLHDGVLSKKEKLLLIEYLLCNNGIGAKTNVGYGQLHRVSNSR